MFAIILALLLVTPSPDFLKQFKEAYDFMAAVAEKMPLWDSDKLGQFERREIQVVKDDIVAAQKAEDADDFLIDIQQLHNDWDLLCAVDDSLNYERVI